MIAARLMPDSSRAVCPLLGRMTRCADGIARTKRPASSKDGSSRSAADATISVGALHQDTAVSPTLLLYLYCVPVACS